MADNIVKLKLYQNSWMGGEVGRCKLLKPSLPFGVGHSQSKTSDMPLNCFALHIFECYPCSTLSIRILNLSGIQCELSSSPFCKRTQQLCGNLKVLDFDDGKFTIANYRFGSWLTKLSVSFK